MSCNDPQLAVHQCYRMISGLSNSVMMSWAIIASLGDARRLLEVRNELSSALQQLHRGRTRHLSYVRSLSPIKQAASPSCPRHFFQSNSQNPKSLHFPMASPSGPVSGKGPITHIVFDMDGLLLDTEKFYTEVQEIILARYNKTFDWSLKAKMMGRKAMESARIFVEETGIGDSISAEDFLVEREAMLQKLFPTSELMPGASRLIRHLHAKGIPIAVATGSHKRHFSLKTQRHSELFSLMHHIVLGDDPEVKQGKPSPDVFLAAARRFEGGPVDPQKILVFEDAPAGVLAAKNAGMCVVMVPDPRLDSSYHDTADEVLSSLLDLSPNCWGLPPFEDVES